MSENMDDLNAKLAKFKRPEVRLHPRDANRLMKATAPSVVEIAVAQTGIPVVIDSTVTEGQMLVLERPDPMEMLQPFRFDDGERRPRCGALDDCPDPKCGDEPVDPGVWKPRKFV